MVEVIIKSEKTVDDKELARANSVLFAEFVENTTVLGRSFDEFVITKKRSLLFFTFDREGKISLDDKFTDREEFDDKVQDYVSKPVFVRDVAKIEGLCSLMYSYFNLFVPKTSMKLVQRYTFENDTAIHERVYVYDNEDEEVAYRSTSKFCQLSTDGLNKVFGDLIEAVYRDHVIEDEEKCGELDNNSMIMKFKNGKVVSAFTSEWGSIS